MICENNVLSKNKMTFPPLHVRGWALIAYALYDLFFFVLIALDYYNSLSSVVPFVAIEIVFSILLIMGLLAIQFGPPRKWIGQAGLILMIVRPLILLAFFLPLLAPGHYRIQSFLSIPRIPLHSFEPVIYFVPYVGYLLVGGLMLQTKRLPKWTGLALIFAGLFYLATQYSGLSQVADSLHKTVLLGATLAEAFAFAGCGRSILHPSSSAE